MGKRGTRREQLRKIIFEAETPAGKAFDIVLLVSILASVVCVSLETVSAIRQNFGEELRLFEWGFTILFSIEYLLRLLCVPKPLKYAFSFFGMIDLLSILPTYAGVFLQGAQSFLVIRSIRLLRIFRVLKLVQFISEASVLAAAIKAARHKIIVFIVGVSCSVIILGAFMYLIEGEENGFTSIPRSIYWAIVTMTTVGYGDIAPKTIFGQSFAALVMILGYGIIAVPTGIVSYEISQAFRNRCNTRSCRHCTLEGHERNAKFCRRCGGSLMGLW